MIMSSQPKGKDKSGKDKGGRPTKQDEATVGKLEQSLQNGFTVSKACELSGIHRDTYYEWKKNDQIFSDRMDRAKKFPEERARQVVVTAIQDGDVNTARWYLERKASGEFSNRLRVKGSIKNDTPNPFDNMTPQELKQLQQGMAQIIAGGGNATDSSSDT